MPQLLTTWALPTAKADGARASSIAAGAIVEYNMLMSLLKTVSRERGCEVILSTSKRECGSRKDRTAKD